MVNKKKKFTYFTLIIIIIIGGTFVFVNNQRKQQIFIEQLVQPFNIKVVTNQNDLLDLSTLLDGKDIELNIDTSFEISGGKYQISKMLSNEKTEYVIFSDKIHYVKRDEDDSIIEDSWYASDMEVLEQIEDLFIKSTLVKQE